MRNLQIEITARPNTNDNTFSFSSLNSFDPNQVYQFENAILNYSIQTSNITSQLLLSMNETVNSENVLRSGQPIQIIDSGNIIFEGVILLPKYTLLPMTENSQGGPYLAITLVPSIFQFTLSPVVFDPDQAKQISSLTGVDIEALLTTNAAQDISTSSLLNYIISNSDYANIWKKTIISEDLPDNLYLMASAEQSRDSVLRSTIDFANVAFYQAENGYCYIRQLDSEINCPFSVDLSNGTNGNTDSNNVGMLQYEYSENGAMTPAVISNYGIIPASTSIAFDVNNNLVAYKPNPKYFPRVEQLQNSGWFIGKLDNAQINQNIISDPAIQEILNGYIIQPNEYITPAQQIGAINQYVAAYQQLLTGKELGQSLTAYSGLQCTISLDDPYMDTIDAQNILGTCIDIQNCDMVKGIIATYSRSYSAMGSYMNLSIVPLGSITGYWYK